MEVAPPVSAVIVVRVGGCGVAERFCSGAAAPRGVTVVGMLVLVAAGRTPTGPTFAEPGVVSVLLAGVVAPGATEPAGPGEAAAGDADCGDSRPATGTGGVWPTGVVVGGAEVPGPDRGPGSSTDEGETMLEGLLTVGSTDVRFGAIRPARCVVGATPSPPCPAVAGTADAPASEPFPSRGTSCGPDDMNAWDGGVGVLGNVPVTADVPVGPTGAPGYVVAVPGSVNGVDALAVAVRSRGEIGPVVVVGSAGPAGRDGSGGRLGVGGSGRPATVAGMG